MARTTPFQLSLGTLISASLSAWLGNLVPFTLLTGLMLSPWIALRIYLSTLPPSVATTIVASLLQILLTYVLTGALTYGVVQQLRGKPAGFGPAMVQGMQSFGRVLGTGLLCGLRIVLFTLLLFIPGIIESVRLYVAIPAAVMEGMAGSAAAERSIRLTDGSRWPIFGSWFVITAIGIALAFVAGFFFVSVDGPLVVMPVWVDIAIAMVVAPLAAVASAVCYFLLRQGKEQIDVEQIAAVFD